MAILQQQKPDNDSRKMLNAAVIGIHEQEKKRCSELDNDFNEFIKPQL